MTAQFPPSTFRQTANAVSFELLSFHDSSIVVPNRMRPVSMVGAAGAAAREAGDAAMSRASPRKQQLSKERENILPSGHFIGRKDLAEQEGRG
jgi:hypothetical protein